MPKDYAKKMVTTKRRAIKKIPRLPVILTVFFVAFAISMTTFWVYAHHGLKESFIIWIANGKSLFQHKNANTSKTAKAHLANQEENNAVQFNFYTELPNMQVNPEIVSESKLTIRKPVVGLPRPIALAQIDNSIQAAMAEKKKVQYFIQLGVFKDQIGASQLRLSLLLAGIEADIVEVATHSYRVQQGPYQSTNQAKAMQRRLTNKGFESEIKSE
jgi:cell division protein FtsN